MYIFENPIPQRRGKQYETPEECLTENGEHVWSPTFDPSQNISCLVDHFDAPCSLHTPTKICYHCPATMRLETKQQEIKEWTIITKD